MSRPEPWSGEEVTAIVETYKKMLVAELCGQHYVKTDHNRELAEKLNNRSKASIEFKHQNISAVLRDADCPYINGYKPMSNYQGMLVDVVERHLLRTELFDQAARNAADRPVIDAPAPKDTSIIVTPPESKTPQTSVQEAKQRYATPTPVKRDYLAREARNHALGSAGERFVVAFEKMRLRKEGRTSLAEKVEHVAETQGDGLGYDVLSFDVDGRERWIEVKTTAFAKECAFFITPNELKCSQANPEHYHLFRIFSFLTQPNMYCLRGDLYPQLTLNPQSYRAHLL